MTIDIKKLSLGEVLELRRQLAKVGWGVRTGKHDYARWDWDKPDKELAAERGVSRSSASRWRKALGQAYVQSTKYYPVCKGWDWAKSDAAIARENRVEIGTVRHWRERLGKPAGPRDLMARSQLDWGKADWAQSDVKVARAVGCTRERARQVRARLGKQKTKRE